MCQGRATVSIASVIGVISMVTIFTRCIGRRRRGMRCRILNRTNSMGGSEDQCIQVKASRNDMFTLVGCFVGYLVGALVGALVGVV